MCKNSLSNAGIKVVRFEHQPYRSGKLRLILCMKIYAGQRKEKKRMKCKSEKERIRKAEDTVLDRLDYIMETMPASDFVEVVGRIGGDTVTYRVYDDGSVYAR